jgi:mRNA-degrading endonuclease HigB of HigAB toxin-antitoxin module
MDNIYKGFLTIIGYKVKQPMNTTQSETGVANPSAEAPRVYRSLKKNLELRKEDDWSATKAVERELKQERGMHDEVEFVGFKNNGRMYGNREAVFRLEGKEYRVPAYVSQSPAASYKIEFMSSEDEVDELFDGDSR